jgi:hypothetical protein
VDEELVKELDALREAIKRDIKEMFDVGCVDVSYLADYGTYYEISITENDAYSLLKSRDLNPGEAYRKQKASLNIMIRKKDVEEIKVYAEIATVTILKYRENSLCYQHIEVEKWIVEGIVNDALRWSK